MMNEGLYFETDSSLEMESEEVRQENCRLNIAARNIQTGDIVTTRNIEWRISQYVCLIKLQAQHSCKEHSDRGHCYH